MKICKINQLQGLKKYYFEQVDDILKKAPYVKKVDIHKDLFPVIFIQIETESGYLPNIELVYHNDFVFRPKFEFWNNQSEIFKELKEIINYIDKSNLFELFKKLETIGDEIIKENAKIENKKLENLENNI